MCVQPLHPYSGEGEEFICNPDEGDLCAIAEVGATAVRRWQNPMLHFDNLVRPGGSSRTKTLEPV